MPINLRLSASPTGTKNLSFNPVVVATETHVFGMDATDTTQYYVPGNGGPAVSTSQYYMASGLYNWRCYNLDDFGSTGATIKAAQGGRQYVYVGGADHPVFGWGFRGGDSTYAGFTFQPWDYPETVSEIFTLHNSFSGTALHPTGGPYISYEFPRIGYNPDDPDGLPIYLWLETGPDHWTAVYRSSDFVTFTLKEFSHWHTPSVGLWSSFVRYYKRNGPNNFTTVALSGTTPDNAIWTSTDGISYTDSGVPIAGFGSGNQVLGSQYSLGLVLTAGGQTYGIGREDATGGSQYATIFAMNSTTLDVQTTPAKVRVASGWAGSSFPGPGFLQEVTGYEEDGIVYAQAAYGFPSNVNTTALGQQRYGAPYADGGGLYEQFMDKIVIRVDDTAARQAAPVGMGVSCASGTATITWKNGLPQNTYRLYRGTDATTQATLIGDYSGVTSATDSPTTGRYWYKLVTLDSGTERKSRVLSVYVSSSNANVNKHINRVLENGGNISTVNRPFLDRMDAMLDTQSIRNILEIFTHAGFGTHATGAPGGFLKIYDLGTTRLPRSQDFKATTSATTYSATGVNGGPAWLNANNNSYGYWGDIRRGNTIKQKRQITIIVAYERTQTTEDFTFVGTGPIWTTTIDGTKVLSLKHTAGTPGSIEFTLCDEAGAKTATVTASGSGLQFACATYDGTDMLAYTGSTPGTAVSTLDPNPNFGKFVSPGPVNNLVNGSLAGARNWQNGGGAPDAFPSPFPLCYPFLGSGSVHNYNKRRIGVADVVTFTETHAKGNIQAVMILEGAINSTKIGNIITELQSTANW